MHISIEVARRLADEALHIMRSGQYEAPGGTVVSIASELAKAVNGTVTYGPESNLPWTKKRGAKAIVRVVNTTTLAAARELIGLRLNPVALNFASATEPGGGFLRGAIAQEEYLARSSGLYACLVNSPMYTYCRKYHDPRYEHFTIYSPLVPVFRADDDQLLEQPDYVPIITSPAVNAGELPPERRHEAIPIMKERIEKVLTTGLAHGHDSIILGAWGCGAFANDPHEIASLFRNALQGKFRDQFTFVYFAILDNSCDKRCLMPFKKAFAGSLR